jgi:predicted ATPase
MRLAPAASRPRFIVLTGGPGAGKTAVLEVARMHLPPFVEVLPEAASIVFRGGFPRRSTPAGRRAAQRTIFRVQQQLEQLAVDEGRARIVLCDRGTLDSLAYWPDDPNDLLSDMGTTLAEELARYASVIHLRPPTLQQGFENKRNPLRLESAAEAAEIDVRIEHAWAEHPRRSFVPSAANFVDKLRDVLAALGEEIQRATASQAPTSLEEGHPAALLEPAPVPANEGRTTAIV